MTGRAVVDIDQGSRVYILVLAVRQEISLFAHTEPYQATQLKIILYLSNFANTAQFGITRVYACHLTPEKSWMRARVLSLYKKLLKLASALSCYKTVTCIRQTYADLLAL